MPNKAAGSDAAEPFVRYFCPTCNLHIAADRVHHGTKAIVHIMRIPATCAGCPPKGVPHIVVEQKVDAVSEGGQV